MGNVYPLDSGRNLILYESGNTLYLRTSVGEGVTRPITLCTDYAGGFSDTVYHGTVYYCYLSTGHNIVIRSITELQELYKLGVHEFKDCLAPQIVSFQDTLLLFYVIKNPANDAYCLRAFFPFETGRNIELPKKEFRYSPKIHITCSQYDMLVSVGEETTELVFSLDADMRFTVWKEHNADEERRYRELEKENREKDRILAEKEAVIKSIKQQYEELMDTALKYKQEAAKWYEMAYKKEAGHIPGEHLLMDQW